MSQTRHRIHINQHVIRRNAKETDLSKHERVITCKTKEVGKKERITYYHSLDILGPSRVVYSPDKPLSCGAKVWIETNSPVVGVEDGR